MSQEVFVENEILISVIRQQKDTLAEIQSALEMGAMFQSPDYDYKSLIRDVEKNLGKLRRWIF